MQGVRGCMFRDLTGQRFTRLVVVSFAGRRRHGACVYCRWVVKCDCGTTKEVDAGNLTSGNTVSCGCLRKEATRLRCVKHGRTGTPEWNAWQSMIKRCYTASHRFFSDYGGRGITVCDAWRESFDRFLADVGFRPSNAHSLDRIDNNGNYQASNCRWATNTEQMNNRRTNVVITIGEIAKTASEWSRVSGVSAITIRHRIRRGWEHQRAVWQQPLNRRTK